MPGVSKFFPHPFPLSLLLLSPRPDVSLRRKEPGARLTALLRFPRAHYRARFMPLCSSAISLAPSFSLSRARGETRRPSLSLSFFSSSWMKNCGHGKTGIPSFREEGRKTKFYSLSPRQCLFETDTFRLGRLPTANFVSSLKRERERIESFEQGRLIIKKMFIYIYIF